jgi:hypothetical protein
MPVLHHQDPVTHYIYNAWQVCELQGTFSIELWRVFRERRKTVTCIVCAAMVR